MRKSQEEESISIIKAMLQSSRVKDNKLKRDGFSWFYNRIERIFRLKDGAVRICHLDKLPSFLQAVSVQDRINTVIHNSRQQTATGDSSCNQFDFKQVLRRLLVKDFCWLLLIELTCFLLLYFFFIMVRQFVLSMLSYYHLVSRTQSQKDESPGAGVFTLQISSLFVQLSLDLPIEEGNQFSITQTAISCLLGIILYTVYNAFEAFSNRLKIGLHTQVRSCLKLMIFAKLELADQKLLDQVDSSLISRLFHTEFEAFTSSFCNITSLVHFNFYSLVILVYYSKASVLSGYMLFLGTIVLTLVSLVIYKKTNSSLKGSLQKSEKLLFEVIQNFISLKYRKSEPYFQKRIIAALGQTLRLECSKDVIVAIIRMLITYLPAFFAVLDLHYFLHDTTWHALGDAHLKSAKLRIFLSNCLTFYIILIYFEHFMKKSLEACRHRLEGGESDKFFDGFFSLSTLRQQSNLVKPQCKAGEIELQCCTALMRTSSYISGILDEFQTRAGDTSHAVHQSFGHSLTTANRSSLNIWFSKAKEARRKRSSRRLFLKSQSMNINRDTSEISIKNVSVKIERGSKICLYGEKDSGHYQLIHLIMGEGSIKSGQLKKSGTISHLNTSSPLFLEAKTIFDNIMMGNRYDEYRYKRVLGCLGLSFSRYRGGDLYELTADASNMTHFDSKMILVARFLYQEADIYLIENLFREETNSLSCINIEAMFGDLLKDKTVLCITREQTIIKNCKQVFIFKNNGLAEVVSVDNFIYSMSLHQNIHDNNVYSLEDVDVEVTTKKYTFTKRLSNAMMFNSLNLDHELKLHKKNLQISQRASLKLKGSNLLEKLIYGIYLVQKRREDGKNTYKFDYYRMAQLLSADLKSWLNRKGFSSYLYWTLLILSCVLVFAVDLAIFCLYQLHLNSLIFPSSPSGVLHFPMNWTAVLVSALLFSMLISLILRIRVGRILIKTTIELQERVLRSIISSEFEEKQKMHQYMLLKIGGACITDLRKTLLSTVPDLLWGIGWQICELVFLNVLFPLYQLLVTLFLGWQANKLFRTAVLLAKKVTPMRLDTGDRMSSFNFQLVKSLSFKRNLNDTKSQRRVLSKMIDHSNLLNIFLMNDINSWCMLRTSLLNFTCVALTCSFLIASHLGFSLISLKFGWVLFWGVKICIQGSVQRKEMSLELVDFAVNIGNSSCIQEYLNIVSRRQAQLAGATKRDHILPSMQKHGDHTVLLKNVFLTFGDSIVLKNLNLRVKRGEKVCLLGCEGVGKSSILNVIAGIFSADEEEKTQIFVLGKNRKITADRDFLESVEVLEADPPLFEGTVRSNLDPACEFSDETLISVLHLFKPGNDSDPEPGRARITHLFNPTLHSPRSTIKESRLQEAQRSARSLEAAPQAKPLIKMKASSRFISIKKHVLGKFQQLSRRPKRNDGRKSPALQLSKQRIQIKKATLGMSNKTSVDNLTAQGMGETASRDLPSVADEHPARIRVYESLKARTHLQLLGKGCPRSFAGSPDKSCRPDSPQKNFIIDDMHHSSQQSSGDSSASRSKPLVALEEDLDRERELPRNSSLPYSKNGVLVEKIESVEEDLSPSSLAKPILRKLDPQHHSPDNHQTADPQTALPSEPARLIKLIALGGRRERSLRPAPAGLPTVLREAKVDTRTPAKKQILNTSSNQASMMKKESRRKTDIFNMEAEVYREQGGIRQLLDKRRPSRVQGLTKEQLVKRIGAQHYQALSELLDSKVEMSGKNVGVESRRYICLCRCVLSKPSLLLVWEEGLKFGMGVGANSKKLLEQLGSSTIITNKKDNCHLLLYQKAFLVDAGTIVESGDPLQLMSDRESMSYNFVRETDPIGFRELKKELKQKQRDSMYQTFSLTQMSEETPRQLKRADSSREQIFINSINQQPSPPKIQVFHRDAKKHVAQPPLSNNSFNFTSEKPSEEVAGDAHRKEFLVTPVNPLRESWNRLETAKDQVVLTSNNLSMPLAKLATASRTTVDIADEPSIKADHRLDSERLSSIKRPSDRNLKQQ